MLKRVLTGLIRSHEQTGEKAKDPLLKTRYYRMAADDFWEEVLSAVKKMPGYKVLHEVKSVGEIVLEKKTFTGRIQDITLTLVKINPNKSAIDVYSASRGSLGDLGSNYRTILDIHSALDRKLKDYKASE
ncbi:DUF1499 domain-containing protein [Paenibacillus gansuensis]|uniref:DUF1499 domain-containing protein n=1 Tax=Paenibacillus gansuensis TaxID=306542 RepID=A0ABW5PEG9_9BACL